MSEDNCPFLVVYDRPRIVWGFLEYYGECRACGGYPLFKWEIEKCKLYWEKCPFQVQAARILKLSFRRGKHAVSTGEQ
ncbi:MAG: hypothetical protein DRJ30_07030 [Candidatus Methanomethylicota archaeon]|nr:MAG: hypothetical protein DRJ30_07030 [Candidatus Verstraetearchaeota archaeon]